MFTPVHIPRKIQDHAAPAPRKTARFAAKHLQTASLALGLCCALIGGAVHAQGASAPAAAAPLARDQVKMERDAFLRNNRWNPVSAQWDPLTKAPRDMSKMTRAQVRDETRQFARTHQWDETKSAWIEVAPRKARK